VMRTWRHREESVLVLLMAWQERQVLTRLKKWKLLGLPPARKLWSQSKVEQEGRIHRSLIMGIIAGGIGDGIWKRRSESVSIGDAIRSGGGIDPGLQVENIGGNAHLAQQRTNDGLMTKSTGTTGEAVPQMIAVRPIAEDMITTIEADNQEKASTIVHMNGVGLIFGV